MKIEIDEFQQPWDDGDYNDTVDQDMVLDWAKKAILEGKYDEYTEIVIRDRFVAPYTAFFLARKNCKLEKLVLDAPIELCAYSTPSYDEKLFGAMCWHVLKDNTNLTTLTDLKTFSSMTLEMLNEAASLDHLKNVKFEDCRWA